MNKNHILLILGVSIGLFFCSSGNKKEDKYANLSNYWIEKIDNGFDQPYYETKLTYPNVVRQTALKGILILRKNHGGDSMRGLLEFKHVPDIAYQTTPDFSVLSKDAEILIGDKKFPLTLEKIQKAPVTTLTGKTASHWKAEFTINQELLNLIPDSNTIKYRFKFDDQDAIMSPSSDGVATIKRLSVL